MAVDRLTSADAGSSAERRRSVRVSAQSNGGGGSSCTFLPTDVTDRADPEAQLGAPPSGSPHDGLPFPRQSFVPSIS
jgi:hypothetical protein